eukprot:2023819-Pyramimonas_sp.AAC.1
MASASLCRVVLLQGLHDSSTAPQKVAFERRRNIFLTILSSSRTCSAVSHIWPRPSSTPRKTIAMSDLSFAAVYSELQSGVGVQK